MKTDNRWFSGIRRGGQNSSHTPRRELYDVKQWERRIEFSYDVVRRAIVVSGAPALASICVVATQSVNARRGRALLLVRTKSEQWNATVRKLGCFRFLTVGRQNMSLSNTSSSFKAQSSQGKYLLRVLRLKNNFTLDFATDGPQVTSGPRLVVTVFVSLDADSRRVYDKYQEPSFVSSGFLISFHVVLKEWRIDCQWHIRITKYKSGHRLFQKFCLSKFTARPVKNWRSFQSS